MAEDVAEVQEEVADLEAVFVEHDDFELDVAFLFFEGLAVGGAF